jgi:phage baseplate assembly protein W
MQLKIGEFGGILKGIEDINQEIMIILTTPLGSIPHRPEYGSRIFEYLDKPEDMARPLIIAESYRALRENSDRFYPEDIKVKSFSVEQIRFEIIGDITDEESDREIALEVLADFTY